uniref:tapasin-related protein n=1 Tax=Doryrhamphus excisus TaxID=161450 RepID=UPI0025ADC2D6|nr:tapasin-related protein [Doryrhamphus excisus]XP_057909968.1 tapasin-related protein [Doryrhamphus excisus]
MVTGIILFGLLTTFVRASGVADVVLSCEFIEDSVRVQGGSVFARTPSTLILKDVTVASDDESLEALTPFVPPFKQDPDLILFETKASSFEIPNVELLLHADCNEQEVMCEITSYTPHGSKKESGSGYFMVSIDVEGADFSAMLILHTLPVVMDQSTLIQSTLNLPMSHAGTLLTDVPFLVFSTVKTPSVPLRGNCLLGCGFRYVEALPDEEVHIEWRQQHRGQGRKILTMKTKLNDPEGSTEVHHDREESSVDAFQVVGQGNASVTLNNLKVTDEGAYICSVSLGPFHGQQVVNLRVVQPPIVSLSETKLVLKANTPQTVRCHCSKYFPLDAQVEWLSRSLTNKEPTIFPDQGFLSSHRKHGDGTYTLSSRLIVPSSVPHGTEIICKVSHPALDAPLFVSVLVEHQEADDYWWVLCFLFVTVLFFYQLLK